MKNKFVVFLMSISLFFQGLEPVFAKPGSSSGRSSGSSSSGRSYSSGSRSSSTSGSRSYSSPSTGRSYSSGSHSTPSHSVSPSSSGKSYSSGSPSKPSTPTVKPSTPSNSGKSYSGGNSPSTVKPSTPSNSGKSYSGGNSNPPVVKSPSTPSDSGKSYSGGNSSPKPNFSGGNSTNKPPPTVSNDGNSKKPQGTNNSLSNSAKKEESKNNLQNSASSQAKNNGPPSNSAKNSPQNSISNDGNSKKPQSNNNSLSNAAKKEESKAKYQAANTPKPTYTTPKGETRPVNSGSAQTVRNYVTHERYITYENRSRGFYSSYYGYPQPYNDFFSPFLMGYLLSSSINSHDRAMWAYNHRDQMDDLRYQQLLEKDADLKARIRVLEQENRQRDPNYVLPEMQDNPDLQYSKEFIDSAYNPVPVQNSVQESGSGAGLFWILIGIICCVILVYYLFIKEY